MFSSYSSYTFSLGENKTISSALLARAGRKKKKKACLVRPRMLDCFIGEDANALTANSSSNLSSE